MLDVKGEQVLVTRDMSEWATEAWEWVLEYQRAHPRCTLHSEVQVDIGLAFGLPVEKNGKTCLWGTSDLFIVTAEELVTFDYKAGFHDVEVEANDQLMLYSIGFEHDYSVFGFDQIRHVIHQPRAGGAKEEVIPAAQLHAWREEHRAAVLEALNPDAPRHPSPIACEWCPAAPDCPELHQHALAVVEDEFTAVDTMTEERLGLLLSKEVMIRNLLKAARAHARKLMCLGQKVPGFKLVEGRRNREWSDPDAAEKVLTTLGHDPWEPRKLISPAQAEKAAGKAAVKDLICKPAGLPTIAPESDKRKEIQLVSEFAELPEEVEDA
jgi:hypothetical protein